jgi:hypothetical protein
MFGGRGLKRSRPRLGCSAIEEGNGINLLTSSSADKLNTPGLSQITCRLCLLMKNLKPKQRTWKVELHMTKKEWSIDKKQFGHLASAESPTTLQNQN